MSARRSGHVLDVEVAGAVTSTMRIAICMSSVHSPGLQLNAPPPFISIGVAGSRDVNS
jgi:hypothetical protein